MRWDVGQRRVFRRVDRRRRGIPDPVQDGVVLVGSQLLGLDEFDLEVFQVLLIQAEPLSQGKGALAFFDLTMCYPSSSPGCCNRWHCAR
jgi:hypothetical protein